jgi:hypothetical protein
MSFTGRAELSCDRHHIRWLGLVTEDLRRRALGRLLAAWDAILADELGERVADDFPRLEILDAALDDLEGQVDRELQVPSTE